MIREPGRLGHSLAHLNRQAMSSEASGKRRAAMRTTGILTVALTTLIAVSAVDTVSLAEAGGARRVERTNSMPAQQTNAAPAGAAARDTTNDKLDKAVKALEASDKMGNVDIQRSNSTAKDKDKGLQPKDKLVNFDVENPRAELTNHVEQIQIKSK
jgi:hypothetical protein